MGWSEDMVNADSWFDKESLAAPHKTVLTDSDDQTKPQGTLSATNAFLGRSSETNMETMLSDFEKIAVLLLCLLVFAVYRWLRHVDGGSVPRTETIRLRSGSY